MKRIAFLDYLRIFACFLVIIVHASENYYIAPDGAMGSQSYLATEADRLWVSLYDGFSRMAVPLFMIISAFLLVPLKEGQTAGQFYRRRFRRILPPFFFFMVVYSTLPLLWGQIDTAASVRDLSRILLNFPSLAGHLWFMYPLISLYLFIPVISPWLKQASKREEQVFIALFALSACMPFLNRWVGDVWGQCHWNQYHMLWYFSGFLGYLVLAHYLHTHLDWSRRKRLAVGSVLLVAGAAATIVSFYVQAVPGVCHSTPAVELGWAFCTLNCAVATTGAFLLFTCIPNRQALRFVTELSKLTFGIYLMHILWLTLWVGVFKDTLALPTAAAIPCIAICTFASSYIACKLISFIPGSKWIIG